MQILKSLGDGVGTAAGVAWPTFGLIFGALGIAVGGLTAIILGSILSGLFLLIAVPITIWSYKNHKRGTQKSFENLENTRKRTGRLVLRYLLGQLNFILFDKKKTELREADRILLLANLKDRINNDLTKSTISEPIKNVLRELLSPKQNVNDDLLFQFWSLVSDKTIVANHQLIFDSKNKQAKALRKKIKAVLQQNKLLGQSSQTSYFGPLFSGVVGFLAAFGSVAGCAAGLIGLLSSVGFAASLATTPMLGWGVLIAAIGFGVIVAVFSIKSSWETSKVHLLISDCEELNEALDAQIHTNISKLHVAQHPDGLPTHPAAASSPVASSVPDSAHRRAMTLAVAPVSLPDHEGSGRSSTTSGDGSSTTSSETEEEAALLPSAPCVAGRVSIFGSGLWRSGGEGPGLSIAEHRLKRTRSASFS